MKTSRLRYIDICKGIGITLMVLSHVGLIGSVGAAANWIIHAFHMPLFFFVSGYLYKSAKDNIPLTEYLKKKAYNLLIPYFSFAMIHLCLGKLIYHYRDMTQLKAIFWVNTTDKLPIANALWFLTAFYVSLITYEVLNRVIHRTYALYAAVIVVAIAGGGPKTVIVPLGIMQGFVGVLFLHLGNRVRHYLEICKKYSDKNRSIVITIAFICCILSSYGNGFVNMRTEDYGNFLLFICNAFVFSVVTLMGSMYIDNKLHFFSRIIAYVGENSIVYLCLNQVFIYFFKYVFSWASKIMALFLVFMFTMLVLAILSYIFNHTKLKVLIGKH